MKNVKKRLMKNVVYKLNYSSQMKNSPVKLLS